MFGGKDAIIALPRTFRGINIHRQKIKIAIVTIVCFSLLAGSRVVAESDGISGSTVNNGCICHGGGVADDSITITLSGLPEGNYSPGESYNLTLSILGGGELSGQNQGGFNLKSSSGELTPVDSFTQVENGELTHTTAGNDVREWNFTWTSPDAGSVTFTTYGNAVDGDASPSTQDLWNGFTITVDGPPSQNNKIGFRTDSGEENNSLPYVLFGFVVMLAIVVLQRLEDEK